MTAGGTVHDLSTDKQPIWIWIWIRGSKEKIQWDSSPGKNETEKKGNCCTRLLQDKLGC